MFGPNVRLAVDLMYGIGKPDVVTYGEYATRLKKSIEDATSELERMYPKSMNARNSFMI